MSFTPTLVIRRVLILKADKLCAGTLHRIARDIFPEADFELVSHVAEASRVMEQAPVDLLLTGVSMTDGDTLDLLATGTDRERCFRRVLVVTGRREQRVLVTLRSLPIDGVFDPSNEGYDQFAFALREVAAGKCYWSPSVLERLNRQNTPASSICRMLTPVEQLVLAVIGDGSDDEEATERLGLKASSIQSVRRSLHRKLGVQHKGELVRLAAQYGFVRFTADGVVRPGYAILMAACHAPVRGQLKPARRVFLSDESIVETPSALP